MVNTQWACLKRKPERQNAGKRCISIDHVYIATLHATDTIYCNIHVQTTGERTFAIISVYLVRVPATHWHVLYRNGMRTGTIRFYLRTCIRFDYVILFVPRNRWCRESCDFAAESNSAPLFDGFSCRQTLHKLRSCNS